MIKKFLKKYRKEALWYLRFLVYKLKNKELLEKDLRSLLRLKPSWITGHLLLGIYSYKTYLVNKDYFQVGALRASAEALVQIEDVPKFQLLLKGLLSSLEKELVESSYLLADFLNTYKQTDPYSILAMNSLGSNYLVLDEKDKARDVYNKIPIRLRSQEVVTALALLK